MTTCDETSKLENIVVKRLRVYSMDTIGVPSRKGVLW